MDSGRGGPTLKTRKSRSARSGLLFPVGKIEQQMRRSGIKRRRLGECAPVYLAAVLEYMTAELVEAAGLQAKKAKVKNKKQGVIMISPSHIVQAVGKDEDLSMVLKNVVVPGGGYYQGFNPILDKLRQEERVRLMEQGQEGGRDEGGEKRPKDPMFGQWIKLQTSLNTTMNTTVQESFDEQVEQDFKAAMERRRRKKELGKSCDSSEDSGYGSVSQSSRDLDRAARKDLNLERRRAKMAEQERSEKELEKAERLAKQRELAKSLAETLKYRPTA